MGQTILSPHVKNLTNQRILPDGRDTFNIVSSRINELQSQFEITVIQSHQSSNTYSIACSWMEMSTIIDSDLASFIDLNRKPNEESVLDYPNFEFNAIRKSQRVFPSLNGSGKIISLKEQMFDAQDIDLRNKQVLLNLESASTSQHATEMATIIAGRGNSLPESRGVISESQIVPSDFNNLLPDDESLLSDNKVYIQNHSYGVGIENYYGAEAVAYDQSIFNQPEILHVFSSGNYGLVLPEEGTYKDLPFANLTGTFKQSKNVLLVAAIDTSLSMSSSASRGPAFDGRLKPELAAYGAKGTSDAAALVTGIASMWQQSYEIGESNPPSSALVKSALISSAEDVGLLGIDFSSGYGSVNAYKALQVLDSGWYKSVTVSSGNSENLVIDIPENISELKLSVCWVDPPHQATTSETVLIHDIDATLNVDGVNYLPWVLDSDPVSVSNHSQASRQQDHLNNVEFFSIDNPASGQAELSLLVPELTTASQDVEISWYLEPKDYFVWNYPTGDSNIKSNAKSRIYWHSSMEKTGDFFWRYQNGEWQQFTSTYLPFGFIDWLTPDTSAVVQLKAEVGDSIFLSDEFVISKRVEFSLGFNCDDQFGLEWNMVKGATSYQVYEMGDEDLRVLTNTTDTTLVVDKKDAEFYTVSPVFEQFEGVRNLALNYKYQGAFCYINFFEPQRNEDYSLDLVLDLSTIVNIERIVFLKVYQGEQEILSEVYPNNDSNFRIYDNQLKPGPIGYQAILYFENGGYQESDFYQILIEEPRKAILFPNPVTGDYLTILSEGEGRIFQVLDSKGKLIREELLDFKVVDIDLIDFRAGVYYYRLVANEEVIDQGKFVRR